GVQAREDLILFNMIADVGQHLGDYTSENDADMIRLLLIDGQTSDCPGCKRKRSCTDFGHSETRSLLRVLVNDNDIGRKLCRGLRTCVRGSIATPKRA